MMTDDLLNYVTISGSQSQLHVSDPQRYITLGVKRIKPAKAP